MQQRRPLRNQGRIYTVDSGSVRYMWHGPHTPRDKGLHSAAGRRLGGGGTQRSPRTPAYTPRRGCRCSREYRCTRPRPQPLGTPRWCRRGRGCTALPAPQAILYLRSLMMMISWFTVHKCGSYVSMLCIVIVYCIFLYVIKFV